jgi:hypothetical protein
MIQYRFTYADLVGLVDAEVPKWRKAAAERTKALRALGRFEDGSPDWGEVKPVFMRIQGGNKCIYCERAIGSEERSLVEQDIEHFRPKGNVDDWKIPESVAKAKIKVTKAPKGKGGYHLLAYHLANYATSCKTCNSRQKKDRFPISGRYGLRGTDPRKLLAKEKPLLICPLGDFDRDPEELITFAGYTPVPLQDNGADTHRAHVTIAFFELDNEDVRGDLFKERAFVITVLWSLLERARDKRFTKEERAKATADAIRLQHAANEHAGCARAFARLYGEDRKQAEIFFKEADAYFESKSGV